MLSTVTISASARNKCRFCAGNSTLLFGYGLDINNDFRSNDSAYSFVDVFAWLRRLLKDNA